MIGVVIGITGATLYVSQQAAEQSLRKGVEQLAQLGVSHFRDLQVERLRNVCSESLSFSRSIRIRQIMLRYRASLDEKDEADLIATTEILYKTAEDELREALRSDNAREHSQQAAFFRLVGPEGKVLSPPGSIDAGFLHQAGRAYLEETLSSISQAMATDQETGYLAPPTRNDGNELLTVVITPIIDARSDEHLGTLAIGYPVPQFTQSSNPSTDLDPIVSEFREGGFRRAIWLDGELFSDEIDRSLRTNVASEVTARFDGTSRSRHDFAAVFDHEPHRVFHQALQPAAYFPAAYQVFLYSLKDSLAAQRASRLKVLGFGGIGLACAFGISLLLAHGLSVPIQELVQGTGEIQRGNFAVTVPVHSRDEIGRLAGAFNEMALGLAQKEKYRSVLDKVSDRAVAERLLQGTVELGGETREVSVLFCDIRGFTALTQGMDPAEVIRMLNEHFTPLTQVVTRHQGVVDKFVGDLIMAIFGAPESYGDDALNASRCALEMIGEREKLNQISQYKIEVGIGVASGPALAGNMGSSNRLNYTVLGERVNLAARLCSKAGRNEVVIDQTTLDRSTDRIQVLPLERLALKGFSEPVQAYQLLAAQPRSPDL
jgi:class 3 adenylate cyclase